MALVIVEGFLKHLGPPRFFAPELLDACAYVFERPRFFRLFIADNHLEFWVDLKRSLATRAAHFNQFFLAFRHNPNLSATERACSRLLIRNDPRPIVQAFDANDLLFWFGRNRHGSHNGLAGSS